MVVKRHWSLRFQGWLFAAVVLQGLLPRQGLAAPPAETNAAPQLTKPPEVIHFVEARYPEAEQASGQAAAVTLALTIDVEGNVTEASVAQSAGESFDAAALEAVRQFKFSPAEIDGKPSPIRILYEYAFSAPEVAPPPTKFEGTIRDQNTGEPLSGITISLRAPGATEPTTATTDEHGAFSFEGIPVGVLEIELKGEQIGTISVEEQLEPGQSLKVAYDVAVAAPVTAPPQTGDDLELLVVAPPLRREVVGTQVNAEEGRKVPGTSGDVLRVVESLPGVARSAAGSGQLVVWGAGPQDTRVYIDGVPFPRLYHEGGLRAVVHPLFVQSVELLPGGYGGAWGRGLGGLVLVSTKTPGHDRIGGQVRADILDASAVLTGPIGRRKRVHYAVGVRASYVKLWAEQFVDPEQRGFIPIPTYGDGQLRFHFEPDSRNDIELALMASSDRFSRGVPNPDPALATVESRKGDFQRLYARWRHDRGNGHVFTVTPFVGYDRRAEQSEFGSTRTAIESQTYLAGLRSSYVAQLKKWLRLEVGIDLQVEVVDLDRVGSLGLPSREGDIRVFGQPPPDQITADAWRVTNLGIAPYAEAEFSLLDGKLRIVPGLRIDPYVRSVSRRNPPESRVPAVGAYRHDFAAEPRLSITGKPVDRLELRAAVGQYHQMPSAEDLSAAFGTPDLPSAKALHVVAGGAVEIVDPLALELTGFYTQSKHLAIRSPAESPLRGRALEPTGRGRAYGLQVLLRQELWKGLFGWIAYTYMRSERSAGPEEPWRLFDFDQTHVLTAVLAYALPLGFDASARFRYATGYPRTDVVDAYFDATRNLEQPVFGGHNEIRIPQFIQLDLRLAKTFDIRRTKLEIFLEVLNLWNRQNAEEIVYSPDYRERAYIRGFPVLPVLGVQWDF